MKEDEREQEDEREDDRDQDARDEKRLRSKDSKNSVDQSAILGEPGTGYEGPEGKGPFECANCEYFSAEDSSCGEKIMKARSARPKTETGRVMVAPKGCCEYVSRVGHEFYQAVAQAGSKSKSSTKP